MTNATHTIEIACDHEEAHGFAAWLIAQGHRATVGRSTGNYVDGRHTSSDEAAHEIMCALWVAYCAEG